MKLHLVLIAPLLLAACGSGPEWRNQQAELANQANGVVPAAEEPVNVAADTDYINETSPAENDVNAVEPTENEAEAPPEG